MNTIITIGRQFGSGGHIIGQKVADHFGIKCYDKELLTRVAKDSGLCVEMIEHQDEKPNNSFLYNLVMEPMSFMSGPNMVMNVPLNQKVFMAQFETIKKIAEEGPCVIVGRCAEYALSDLPNKLHIFISSTEKFRVAELRKRYPDIDTDQKAIDMMKRKDKERKNYYNYYSSNQWGHAESYDLVVNSSVLGIDGTSKLIVQFVEDFEAGRG